MKTIAHRWLWAASIVSLTACRTRDRTHGEQERSAADSERRHRDPNEQDKSGTTTITGADWVSNDAAVDRIVMSRCAREVACGTIGPDKHFADGEVCVREVRKRTEEGLKVTECPGGIDGKELDACLDAIRSESCTTPIETLSRLATCRTGALCRKIETPHR